MSTARKTQRLFFESKMVWKSGITDSNSSQKSTELTPGFFPTEIDVIPIPLNNIHLSTFGTYIRITSVNTLFLVTC